MVAVQLRGHVEPEPARRNEQRPFRPALVAAVEVRLLVGGPLCGAPHHRGHPLGQLLADRHRTSSFNRFTA